MKTRVTYAARIDVVVDHATGAVESVRLTPPADDDGWVLSTQLLNEDGTPASRADFDAAYPGADHAPDPFPLLDGAVRIEAGARLGRAGWTEA
jgi:hypothetical protein